MAVCLVQYLIFTNDLSTTLSTITATLADDTTVLASNHNHQIAS